MYVDTYVFSGATFENERFEFLLGPKSLPKKKKKYLPSPFYIGPGKVLFL